MCFLLSAAICLWVGSCKVISPLITVKYSYIRSILTKVPSISMGPNSYVQCDGKRKHLVKKHEAV